MEIYCWLTLFTASPKQLASLQFTGVVTEDAVHLPALAHQFTNHKLLKIGDLEVVRLVGYGWPGAVHLNPARPHMHISK